MDKLIRTLTSIAMCLLLASAVVSQDMFDTTVEVEQRPELTVVIGETAVITQNKNTAVVTLTKAEKAFLSVVDVKVTTKATRFNLVVKDKAGKRLPVVRVEGGILRLNAPTGSYAGQVILLDEDQGFDVLDTVIQVGGSSPPPDNPPPDTPPPTGKFYFLVVRDNGPASPSFTKTMSNPGWAKLLIDGHVFKDKTLSEATASGFNIPSGTKLPIVLTLKVSSDWKSSVLVGHPKPLPDNEADILRLKEVQ